MKGRRLHQDSGMLRQWWPLLVPPHLNVVSDLSREREIKPSRTGSRLFQLLISGRKKKGKGSALPRAACALRSTHLAFPKEKVKFDFITTCVRCRLRGFCGDENPVMVTVCEHLGTVIPWRKNLQSRQVQETLFFISVFPRKVWDLSPQSGNPALNSISFVFDMRLLNMTGLKYSRSLWLGC